MSKYISLEEFRSQYSSSNNRPKVERCAYCHQVLGDVSFKVNGKKICASCYEKNKAKYEKHKADRAIDKALAIDIEYDGYGEEDKAKSRNHGIEVEN